jgi:uncharacterized membrane protein YeaQ/YmgE (transglycosylase-associated protein family)
MNLVLLLMVGGLIGWVGSLILGDDARQCIVLNMIMGMTGALLAGVLAAPFFGEAPITSTGLSVETLLFSACGSVLLLAFVTLIEHRSIIRPSDQ